MFHMMFNRRTNRLLAYVTALSFFLLFLFSESSFASNNELLERDVRVIIFPKESFPDFCLTKTSDCLIRSLKTKYMGMKGTLKSLTPFHDGVYKVFEILMDNGVTLFFHTRDETPFTDGQVLDLKNHEAILALVGKSVIPGGAVKVTQVNHTYGRFRSHTYKIALSVGGAVYQDSFKTLRNFLQHIPKGDEVEFVKRFKHFDIAYDEFDDVFRIRLDTFRYKDLSLNPYVRFGEGATLVTAVKYVGEGWLFVEYVTVKTDNTKKDIYNLKFNRDTIYGGNVKESAITTEASYTTLLEDVVSSNTALVRFSGKRYYSDSRVSKTQKQGIGHILWVYELLKQKDNKG